LQQQPQRVLADLRPECDNGRVFALDRGSEINFSGRLLLGNAAESLDGRADIGRLSCIKPNGPAKKLRRSILASISAAEDFSQALAAE
jgi:hypothetical protein